MKTLFLILAIVGGLLLAHNYIQTGEIGFGGSMSETERELRRLEQRLADAERSYRLAGRGSAIGGMEGSSGAESALGEVRAVERELARIEERVTTEPERKRLESLKQSLRELQREMGVGGGAVG